MFTESMFLRNDDDGGDDDDDDDEWKCSSADVAVYAICERGFGWMQKLLWERLMQFSSRAPSRYLVIEEISGSKTDRDPIIMADDVINSPCGTYELLNSSNKYYC